MIWKHKKILIWNKNINKKLNFFKNIFEIQKQTGVGLLFFKKKSWKICQPVEEKKTILRFVMWRGEALH
jgi:hypothetical protein